LGQEVALSVLLIATEIPPRQDSFAQVFF
jgi:hypothetical protein